MSNQTIEQQLDALKAKIPSLDQKDQNFANNLIKFYADNHRLSQKQLFWVNELANRQGKTAIPTMPVKQDEGEIEVGKLDTLQGLFDRAKKFIKMPAVIFNVTGVGHVMFGVPYNRSDKGIEVCIKKQGYGYQYIGTVEDEFFFPKNRWYEVPPRVIELAKALSNDPVHTLIEYGKNSGICACCGAGLEDPDSVKRGIGPVCRRNYGLESLEDLMLGKKKQP